MIQIHGLIVVCALKIAQVCVKVGNVAFKTIFVSLNFLGVIWWCMQNHAFHINNF
jgi:hypothetical protein